MTHQNYNILSAGTIKEITRNGLNAVPDLMRVFHNNAMQVERAKYLQAEEYERTKD
jgi:putative transposase